MGKISRSGHEGAKASLGWGEEKESSISETHRRDPAGRQTRPAKRGRAVLVRFADDALLVFTSEEDAKRVLAVLPKRFGKYGLSLHPEKTRSVDFRRPGRPKSGPGVAEEGGPGVFNLLGFTHYWGRTRRGGWAVKHKTAKDRFGRALKRVAEWCRANRHLPVREQHQGLILKLRGHFQYYGIIGNSAALKRFLFEVTRVWHKWLNRRSQRGNMPWGRFQPLLDRYSLPLPRPRHPAVC